MQSRQRNLTAQTLASVLAASDRAPAGAGAWFQDEPALRAAVRISDHVLYRAERDVLRPRTGRTEWRLDRVSYPAGDLPSGELNRSTGHWNAPAQWEVFQVDGGEVVMVVRGPGAGRPIELIRCGPGSLLPLLPGSWHLTYVWSGPAVVTNAYSLVADHRGPNGKYFARRSVRCGLRRAGSGVVVVRDEADPAAGRGEPVWRVAQQRTRLDPELPPLERIFADDPDGRLLARLEGLCAQWAEADSRPRCG